MDQVQFLVNPARLQVDQLGQEAVREEVQTSSIKHRAGQIEVMDPGLTDRRLTNHQAGQPEMMDPGLTDHKSKVSTDLKKGLSHINLC